MAHAQTISESGNQANALHSNESPFIPVSGDFVSTTNHQWDIQSIAAKTDTTNQTIFELPTGDKSYIIARVELLYTIGAHTAGGSGTYQRNVDFGAFAYLKDARFKQGSNEIQILTGRNIHDKYRKELDDSRFLALSEAVGGLRTTTERNTLSQSAQAWQHDLPFYFTEDLSYALPTGQLSGAGGLLTIELNWQNVAYCIQTDHSTGSPSFSRSVAPVLRLHTVKLTSMEAKKLSELCNTGDGIIYKILGHQTQELIQIDSGTAADIDIRKRIENINKEVHELSFRIMPQTAITGSYTQVGPYENFQRIKQFKLEDSGNEIMRTQTHVPFMLDSKNRYYHGHRYDIYDIPVSDKPFAHDYSSAHWNFDKFNNPELVFQLTSGVTPSANWRLDINARVHEFIQIKNGVITNQPPSYALPK